MARLGLLGLGARPRDGWERILLGTSAPPRFALAPSTASFYNDTHEVLFVKTGSVKAGGNTHRRMPVTSAIATLTQLVDAEDRFDHSHSELRETQVEALNERFHERKDRIKLLAHRAREPAPPRSAAATTWCRCSSRTASTRAIRKAF